MEVCEVIDRDEMEPMTKDEWWKILNRNWDKVYAIMCRYMDMTRRLKSNGNIRIMDHVKKLRETLDPEIATWLERAWEAAPDRPEIHLNPGWSTFCDLCSERYVLFEDQPKD
jgi:hypothetical protein